MKAILSTAVVSLLAMTTVSYAGLFDGKPTDPVKRARTGGYNEQVANRNSLMTPCKMLALKDGAGNVVGYACT